MSILILPPLLGGILFLFIFWKRLREDYSSELIFNSGTIFVLLIIAGFFLFRLAAGLIAETPIFNPNGLWFWGSIGGFLLAFLLSLKKFKLRAVETFEAAAIASLCWLLLVYASNLVWPSFALVLILLAVFYQLERNYKRFSWYKSGRKGFSGQAVVGIFFLYRFVAALVSPSSFSLLGRVELIPSAAATFLLLFSLYNLSESKNGR